MGPETGNGRFGFVLGLRGKESFWLARGENETEGKRLESGRKGVFVLWSSVCGVIRQPSIARNGNLGKAREMAYAACLCGGILPCSH
ncbi:hypothetical protein NC652_000343 [Populus alba x Populus x berolinensis]|nr:hypothetical protein NC652_000343 [Populus alba x Populus x berolinensis]